MNANRLQAIGIIQEQHPERTQLFNQWKRLSMDLLVDPLNALDVSGVPIVLLVDEHGIIRFRNLQSEQLDEFLQADYAIDQRPTTAVVPGQQWAAGDELVLTGQLDEGIDYYRTALRHSPDEARLYFRLGVALRMRYDSTGGDQDFADAVASWVEARRRDPNQYIWRRRIQQYGPVLDKPYPFYDWVAQARLEISDRGEVPRPLHVEPQGAELAQPGSAAQLAQSAEAPDSAGKLHRDAGQMVHMKTLVVRSTDVTQPVARVHLVLSPNVVDGFAWNNEAEPLQVWIHPHAMLRSSHQRLQIDNPPAATSEERRTLDFEVAWPSNADWTAEALQGHVVYNVCNKRTGECLIRRQDFEIVGSSYE